MIYRLWQRLCTCIRDLHALNLRLSGLGSTCHDLRHHHNNYNTSQYVRRHILRRFRTAVGSGDLKRAVLLTRTYLLIDEHKDSWDRAVRGGLCLEGEAGGTRRLRKGPKKVAGRRVRGSMTSPLRWEISTEKVDEGGGGGGEFIS